MSAAPSGSVRGPGSAGAFACDPPLDASCKRTMTLIRALPPINENEKVKLLGKVGRSLVSKLAGVSMSDIHEDNIRQKRSDLQVCVFTDLGY